MPPPTKRASQPQNKLPTLQEATNEISTKASFLASNEAAVASESSKGGKFSENIMFWSYLQTIQLNVYETGVFT